MLFGKSKSPKKLSRGMIDFLNKADAAYMTAYNTRSLRDLQQYISRECSITVSQRIHGIGSRYFGSAKFRNTSWELQGCEGNIFKILKDVVFDKITVAGAMRVSAADDYKEMWVLEVNGSKMVITEINTVKG